MRARVMGIMALAGVMAVTGCGYHALGSATHLPEGARTLAVPLFATKTNSYHTETVMTQAVLREFATRTRLKVTPDATVDPDVTLHGTIMQESVTPLTYNTSTQQSSSYLVTVVIAVELTGRDGRVLYANKNYVFRQQYQSTTSLPVYFDESPAAVERLSKDFARALVADVLEGL
ncbi:MAG TPA: LPS assembly lipoprotein LptE [Terracidiphilus sp.]|nr:LPS assembly lipoprotein LptE [Terracidiphilus sp.]